MLSKLKDDGCKEDSARKMLTYKNNPNCEMKLIPKGNLLADYLEFEDQGIEDQPEADDCSEWPKL